MKRTPQTMLGKLLLSVFSIAGFAFYAAIVVTTAFVMSVNTLAGHLHEIWSPKS